MSRFKLLVTFVVMTFMSFNSYSARILLTEFEYGPDTYTSMKSNLENAGFTVDIVNAKIAGNVASALISNVYDQVFLWDLSSTLYLDNSDVTALSDFWNMNSSLVVDTRSYGHYFQGNSSSEVALLTNIANSLDAAGGGIWVGTDGAPIWTRNANALFPAIGVSEVTGDVGFPVNYADPSSVLLDGVGTTDLWTGSVGIAPVGLQANGKEMFIHYGNVNSSGLITPYISATFDLGGNDPTVDVSAPSMLTLLLGALCLLLWRRNA